MEVINEIGLYPLLREFANADPDLYSQVKCVFMFNFPLLDSLLAVTKENRCYAFGTNHQEALGFKVTKKANKVMNKLARPRELEVLKYKEIDSIVFNRHVMVLTTDNELIGWGRNENAPLSKANHSKAICVSPSQILNGVKKVDTHQHTIVIDLDGKVQCFGLNRFGQCDPNNLDDIIRRPARLFMIKDKAIDAVCSSTTSAALTETNKLYMWGTLQERLINIKQLMNPSGKHFKLVCVEHKYTLTLNDTWLITLNREHQVHVHRVNFKTGRLHSTKLILPPIIIDIIGSNDANFALITNDGRSFLFKQKAGEPSTHYQIITSRSSSYMDTAKLNGMVLKSKRLSYLLKPAKNMDTIRELGSFDMRIGTDFTVCWEDWIYPKIRVQSSVLFNHNPYLMFNLKGNQLCWSLTKYRRVLSSSRSFRYQNRPYPSYSAMYAYLIYVYLNYLPAIELDMDELYALARYLNDDKLETYIEDIIISSQFKMDEDSKTDIKLFDQANFVKEEEYETKPIIKIKSPPWTPPESIVSPKLSQSKKIKKEEDDQCELRIKREVRSPSVERVKDKKGKDTSKIKREVRSPSIERVKNKKGVDTSKIKQEERSPSIERVKNKKGVDTSKIKQEERSPSIERVKNKKGVDTSKIKKEERSPSIERVKNKKGVDTSKIKKEERSSSIERVKNKKGKLTIKIKKEERSPSIKRVKDKKGVDKSKTKILKKSNKKRLTLVDINETNRKMKLLVDDGSLKKLKKLVVKAQKPRVINPRVIKKVSKVTKQQVLQRKQNPHQKSHEADKKPLIIMKFDKSGGIETSFSLKQVARPSTAAANTATPSKAATSTATSSKASTSTATSSKATPKTAATSTARPSTATPKTAMTSTARPSSATPKTAMISTARPSSATPKTAMISTARPSSAKPITATTSAAKPITARPSSATPKTAAKSKTTKSVATSKSSQKTSSKKAPIAAAASTGTKNKPITTVRGPVPKANPKTVATTVTAASTGTKNKSNPKANPKTVATTAAAASTGTKNKSKPKANPKTVATSVAAAPAEIEKRPTVQVRQPDPNHRGYRKKATTSAAASAGTKNKSNSKAISKTVATTVAAASAETTEKRPNMQGRHPDPNNRSNRKNQKK